MPDLDDEQEQLLATLVEAALDAPREQREFHLARIWGGAVVFGNALPENLPVLPQDVEELELAGLIRMRGDSFTITNNGFAYVEEMERRGEPVERIEADVLAYLHEPKFRNNHPEAFRLWSEAERLLHGEDTQRQLTTIGLKLREAAQAFATDLVEQYRPPGASDKESDTHARVESVVKAKLGEKVALSLTALLHYWGTVNDVIQRQVHKTQGLTHEDGRRAVFLLAIAIYEIDRALDFTRPPPVLGS